MAKKFANLQRTDNNKPITKETHYEFLDHLQRAMLLALRERGRLNAMQYHHAKEKLEQAKSILEKGGRK